MIVIVAPYSPAGRGATPHLGAARKIEAVVQILSERRESLVLINTAHDGTTKRPLEMVPAIIGGVPVLEVFPPMSSNKRLGKLRNFLDVPKVISAIFELGRPSLVWLYNGYAFESRFGRLVRKATGCPVIQEMEDWHFSRSRGLNPKPLLDWLAWRMVRPHVSFAFAVNAFLAGRLGGVDEKVGLFPGVVAEGVARIAQGSVPFSRGGESVTVGYFGGLSAEKGADLVLRLAEELKPGFKLLVTGSGELERRFSEMGAYCGDRLEFHGRVDDAMLLELMERCDVLLNPHSPIESMANGVFPFKVIEGIASGRLMISTSLPSVGLESVLQGVHFIGHEFSDLKRAVEISRDTYASRVDQVERGASEAARRFGKGAVLSTVNRVCEGALA